MNRTTRIVLAGLVAAIAFAARAGTGFVAKAYEFKPNTALAVGLDLEGGARLDSVEFVVPEGEPEGMLASSPRAKVKISNVGDKPVKIGLAVALIDGDGHLVSAGSGGTKLLPLRAGRQITYTVDVGDVRSKIATATTFHLTIETTY